MASAKGKADNGEGDATIDGCRMGRRYDWRMPDAMQLTQASRCVPWSLVGRNYALYEPAKAINSRIGGEDGRLVRASNLALSRANGKPDSGQVHSLVLSFKGFFREGFAIFLHCPMFRERLNE